MAEKILCMFVGLLVGIWGTRYLGSEKFGLLSYAQSFVFLFTAIAVQLTSNNQYTSSVTLPPVFLFSFKNNRLIYYV